LTSASTPVSPNPGEAVTLQERRSWTFLVTSVVAYVGYVWYIVTHADGAPLADSSYQKPLLVTIVAAIVANIAAEILLAIVRPIDTHKDVRDKEIGQIGDFTGSAFVVIGALAGLLLALGEKDYFWVANAIYLGFVLSAILGSLTKIGLYRKGMY
jgi:hypothetical protein